MKFAILASFDGASLDGWSDQMTIDDVSNYLSNTWAADLQIDETEPGDSEYCYLADESDDPEFWENCRNITASGILDRADFFSFFDAVCSYAENCETLGTLGGPANPIGLAPDVPVELESRHVIASIRVTPLPDHGKYSEKNWNAVRRAFLNLFGLHKVDHDCCDIPGTYADAWRDFRR